MAQEHVTRIPVIGVGASAGGVEALEGFFKGIPSNPGFAIVVITHLSPDRESHLPQIIARNTALDVRVAENGVKVEPNTAYVLASDAVLRFHNGHLDIQPTTAGRRERKPIDVFLSSLASELRHYSAAVILSGGDGDGTLGVKAVKERGGLTIAQVANGDGPSHPDMPESALSTGFVDFALPAHLMGEKLVEFAHSLSEPIPGIAGEDELDGEHSGGAASEIYTILRNQTGHDFAGYKAKTFLRRVQRRMQVVQLATIEAYAEQLRDDPREVVALFRDLLITVTNFFRDADAFEALKTIVIPKLLEGRGANDAVRVWVPGCATGEEVYSIAMLFREQMDAARGQPRVQIFATDIDERALSVARAGRYPEALLDTVSPERLTRFFIPDGGSYVLTKEVRDLCIFSPHSVIRDPPFSRIDLVSCRNLLIYFGPEIQNQVIPTFHYSLRQGGYLFLGTAENVSQFTELFSPVEKKSRIFRARDDQFSIARLPLSLTGLRTASQPDVRGRSAPTRGIAFRQTVEAQVLERFGPPHVVVDRDGEIVYYSGRTGKYLEAAVGSPTRQLFSLARKGLRLDLRALFREVVETGHSASREAIEVDTDDGKIQLISVSIEPLLEPKADERLYVVLFNDQGRPVSRDAASRPGGPDDRTLVQLEAELRETKERLQGVVEEYETALEELKSSNEELVSVNEELQSTNEELEASKEELQSLNEELHTVNAELNGKVDQLDAANTDLQNLFENTQVAMVFLDRELQIRTFTPAMSQIFNILPGDRGRPLTDLSSQLSLASLKRDVERAVISGETSEAHLSHEGGSAHYLVRVAPYHDADKRIGGAVVTFINVTSLTEAEQHHKTLIAELNHRVKNMLGVVVGLVQQSGRKADSVEHLMESLGSRLQAMARSYELLSNQDWKPALIEQFVDLELAPFDRDRVSLSGADIRLPPRLGLALSMILHELATNSVKYGAFSAAEGKIDVAWRLDRNSQVKLTWRERGGPAPLARPRNGFGMTLIEGQGRHALSGATKTKYGQEGLEFELSFPLAAT